MAFPLLVFLTFAALSFYYFWQRNRYFEKLNIASPPAIPLLGHLHEFASVPFGIKVQEWARKYGKVFGIYEGGVPVLITSDLDICQDVFIKQYERFHSRKHFPLAKDPETDKYASMFTARGARWKRLRTISNPVFKQSNLKRLCPLLENACNDFMEILAEDTKDGKSIDIMKNFQLFTCDTIARVAFGENRNMQRPGTNPYLDFCKVFFPDKPVFLSSLFHLLPMIFPGARIPIAWLYHFVTSRKHNDAWYSLQRMVTDLIETRRQKGPGEYPDFIDLFLETESSDELNITSESTQADIKKLHVDKRLLTEEIVGQLMLFLIAGYETTSNSLSYVTYHLALNQECQEKLRNEILSITGGATEITYEMCSQMRYTELCIKEALRLYPLASFVQSRTCMNTTEVGKEPNKLKIPEGLVVTVDAWSIQRDRSFWGEDADEFRPERFDEVNQAEINNYWVPFGIGPRICIGMRFAILEQKILLSQILQRFRVERSDETKVPIELQGGATVVAKDVFVKFSPLNE